MIANHKGEIPVVVLILPFLAGITSALYFINIGDSLILGALILLTFLFIALNFFYKRLSIYKIRWLGGALLYPILFLMGWFVTIQHNELNKRNHFAKAAYSQLVAVITSEPKVKDNIVRFTADIREGINNGRQIRTSGTLLVTIKDDLAKNLFYGEQLLLPARYSPVDPPFNPGEFDYKSYLANNNVHYQAYYFPKQYKIISAGKGNAIIAYALQLRQKMVDKFKRNMQDTAAIAVASTLILGYKADLSNDVLQAYSKTGTIHILSVSGGHVAIIYLLLSWALAFLNTHHRGRVLKAVLIITLIWAYSLLTGFSPAVCRAAVMISLIITGKTYSRYINTLNLLAASAFVLLLYNPLLLLDVGFQLSYLAVAGLIIFQPVVYKWFIFKNRVADKLWLTCSVSIAAQVITFPLSAYYFHQFPVYFLVSNILIIVPVSIIMYSGLLLLALPQLPFISKALGYILEHTILLMNKGLATIEDLPFASINKIWLTRWEYLLLCAIIVLVFYFIYGKQRWIMTTLLTCILLFAFSISLKKYRADTSQSITFLNLRKHTGIVFKNGSEGIVITEIAETDRTFKFSIQPCLDSSRIFTYKVYQPNESISSSYLLKKNALVQFKNKRLLLLNDSSNIKSIPQQLNVNYLYVSDNSPFDKKLLENKLLILGSNNTEHYVQNLLSGLKDSSIDFKTLKRNKSVCITSN